MTATKEQKRTEGSAPAPSSDMSRATLACPRCGTALTVVADGVAPRRALVYRPWKGESPAPGSTDRPGTSLTWRTYAWCPRCEAGVRLRTQARMDTPARRA